MDSELMKPWNSNLKAQPSLGIIGLLRESFKTSTRNRELLLSVLFVVFLLSSQLDFVKIYFLKPVAKDLSLPFNSTPEVLLANLLIFTLTSIISIVSLVATVLSSSKAYTSEVIDQKAMIFKVKKSWKKPMRSFFYMILITVGLIFSIGIISILAEDIWPLYLFSGVFFRLITVVVFYISAVWMMSLVVSVLEDVGCLNAIVRAIELIKGKNVQAYFIMVVFALAYCLIHSMTNDIKTQSPEKWSQLAISIPFTNGLLWVLKLFLFVVFTVFYHDQKESCDGKRVMKSFYVPVAVGKV